MTRPAAAPGTSPLQPTDPETHAGHRLLARLGTGGSGTVYLARNPEGRVVALKVFRTAAARPAEAAALRSLAGKEHFPGFVDAGEDWHTTAYVIGPSLASTVTAHGPWPEPALRALAAELAAALTELHATGLVHRDLKPANVLLTAARPVVVDLGLAAPPDAPAPPGGTPAYLSPEQAAGHPVGPPADVHALGALLVHAATGRPPYGDGDAGEILYRLAHQRPDLDAVPDTLRPLLAACLEQDPAARPTPAQIRERAAAQGPFGDRLPRPVLTAVAARLAAAGTTAVHRPDPATARGPARRRVLAASGGALLAAAVGGTAWALTAGQDPKPPAPPVSGPSPSRGPDGAPPPDWTFRGNIDPAGARTPMPFDDVVVVPADLEGTLLGVDTRRGTLRWSTATGAGAGALPVGDAVVLTAGERAPGRLCVVRAADGSSWFTQDLGIDTSRMTQPVIGSGERHVLVIGHEPGRPPATRPQDLDRSLLCYDIRDRRVLWRTTLQRSAARYATVAGADKYVVFLETGAVTAYRLLTGERVWRRELLDDVLRVDKETGQAARAIVARHDTVFVSGRGCLCLDLSDGHSLWSVTATELGQDSNGDEILPGRPLYGAAWIEGKTIYTTFLAGQMMAVRRDTRRRRAGGHWLWKSSAELAAPPAAPPLAAGRYLFPPVAPGEDIAAIAVDKKTFRTAWTCTVADEPTGATRLATHRGRLYLTRGHSLVALPLDT